MSAPGHGVRVVVGRVEQAGDLGRGKEKWVHSAEKSTYSFLALATRVPYAWVIDGLLSQDNAPMEGIRALPPLSLPSPGRAIPRSR